MLLRQLFDHETWTYTYLLADELTGDCGHHRPSAWSSGPGTSCSSMNLGLS